MYAWFVAPKWLHLLAATVWIGGLAFVSLVLVPTLRAPGPRPQALLLVLTIVALSLYHDLVIGPRAARALEVDTTSGLAQSLRRQAAWLGRLNALLSLLVLTLALLMVRGVPF